MPTDSVLGTIAVQFAQGAFSGTGGPTTSMPGGNGSGADKNAKEQTSILSSMRKSAAETAKGMGSQPRWWTKALKTMGIQMGISGILKQSQIFTSTLGSLFQILGAFVDIMLAPWIPIIVPGLRKLADQIPRMRVAAQKFFDFAMGRPVWIIQKIWGILQKIFSKTWWTDTIKAGLAELKASMPGFMTPVIDAVGLVAGKLGAVGVAISGLAATWAAAKLARYGLQATRYIPFVNTFTEPVRLLSKGVDKLFNKTASILGSVLGKAVDAILMRLGLKAPKVPTPTASTRPWVTEEDMIPGRKPSTVRTTTTRPGQLPRKPPGSGPPARPWSSLDELDDIFNDYTPPGKAIPKKFVPTGPDVVGGGQSDEIAKMNKASKAIGKFRTWLDNFLKTAAGKAARGGGGIKSLIAEGFRLGGTAIMASRGGPLIRGAAALGAKFLKAIPFIGAAYMTAETTFDLKRMVSSDVGWTGDVGSYRAWEAEAKGWAAEMIGGGGLLGGMLPGGSLFGAALSLLPGDIGKKFTGKMGRWKNDQEALGAISSGKAMDVGIRAVTGYTGAALSFAPLIGQLAGGLLYEGGRYGTTGVNLPFDWAGGHAGTDKYGNVEMTDFMIDKLVSAFQSMNNNITLEGASAEMMSGLA